MQRVIKIAIFLCLSSLVMCSRGREFASNEVKKVDSANDKRLVSLELALRANDYYEEKRYDSALKYLDALIEIDSLNGQSFYRRGYAKLQLSLYQSSSADFSRSIVFKYKIPQAYYNIGINELLLGNDSLAALNFKKCLEIDPKYDKAREMLNSFNKSKSSI